MSDRPNFIAQLRAAVARQKSALCVGLDPLPNSMPAGLARSASGVLEFCTRIVDAVAGSVCAFKPQIAHFAALGAEAELALLIRHIHERHPGIPVILDAKRGDIGSTTERYAVEAFDRYDADAVTANPYHGSEGLMPLLRRAERGVVVLCRSSNASSAEIQCFPESDPLYLRIARRAAGDWNFNGNVALVAGATFPDELSRIRQAAPELPLLVPGIGQQGGELAAALAAGLDAQGSGLVINSARAVCYASTGPDFAEAASTSAESLRREINELVDIHVEKSTN